MIEPVWVGMEHQYRIDDAFARVSAIAATQSGMSEFSKYQLWHMMGEAAKLPSGDILEIGCASGGSGFMIASRAAADKVPARMWLVDTFDGLVKSSAVDVHQNGAMRGPTAVGVREFLDSNGVSGVTVLSGTFPDAFDFTDIQFRFVHLDVDIYQSMKDAFEAIWPRMVPGGIVVLDDYGEAECPGVTKFVDEVLSMPDACWFLHGALQAIAVKR